MRLNVAHKLELISEDLAEPFIVPMHEAEAVAGQTIDGFLARAGWRFDLPTICLINGEAYGRAEWSTYHFAVNDNVAFVSRPLGGGSSSGGSSAKSIGAIVGLIALTALAPYVVGPAMMGLTGFAATAAKALLIGGGALLISHFTKPKTSGKSSTTEELYSFAFGSNAARPLQAIPVGYGRCLNRPDLASPSYSEYAGDSMVEYGLYSLGCGRYDLEELRLDDTTIWTSDGGWEQAFAGFQLELYQPGQQVTLFPINVVTASEVGGAELGLDWVGGFAVNAAGTLATEIIVDFVWPSGAYVTYKDRQLQTPTHIVVEARLIDGGGAPAGNWNVIFQNIYSFSKQSQIRVTEHIPVAPARYEVRVRRVNASVTGQTLFDGKVSGTDTVNWTALRSHIDGPQSFAGVTTLALRAPASASVQGVTNGKLGVIATRILPVWRSDLQTFVEEPTRSIAWAALDAWRNADYSAGLSLDNVDFQSFVAYDALWADLGHSFDYVFTEPSTLDEALDTILKAGRAFPAFVGDKLVIVRDEPRGIPRMMFNDNTITKGSLSVDYVLADDQFADGVEGQYIDEYTWRPATITSAPGGALLAKPAQIEIKGVVNRAQAAGLVRFHAAESQYRRIMVEWQTGAAGKLLKQGDLVTLSSEEPETWGQSAEIVDYDSPTRRLFLSPAPEWDPDALNHYVQVERRDGQPWGPVRVTRGISDDIALVLGSDLTSEAERQGMTLWDAIARSDLSERPVVDFSAGEPRSFRVVITEGEPDQDGEHMTLKGVMDAPEVYAVDETGVPPLPTIPDIYSGSFPVIKFIAIQVIQRQLALVALVGWQPPQGAVSYLAEISYDRGASWLEAYRGDRSSFEAIVAGARTVRVRVCGITLSDQPGAWSYAEAAVPDLEASNAYVTFKITPEDFRSNIQRDFNSLAPIVALADAIGGATTLADDANEKAKASIKQIAEVEVDLAKARAIFGTVVETQYEQNGATVSDFLAALSQESYAQAQETNEVKVALNGLSADVVEQKDAQALINGQLFSSYTVKVGVNGIWGGFQVITATGEGGAVISELKIATDKFLLYPVGATGANAEAVFTIGTKGGVARAVLRGDFYGDGMIGAAAIQAQALSAISANLGTVTAGNIIISGAAGSIQMYD